MSLIAGTSNDTKKIHKNFSDCFIIFNFNLVDFLFGNGSLLARITYIIIGICGIMNIALLLRPIHTDTLVQE